MSTREELRKPRASGDDPTPEYAVLRGGFVNPARAGMIRRHGAVLGERLRKPRASGDDPACPPQETAGIV